MVSPINSLTNMEYMLYGGASGVNPNCPSFSNGYMANRNSWNYQTPFGYNNQSIWNNQYGQNYGYGNVGGASATTSNTQQASQTGFGASSRDLDTLGKYYLKGMEPSESLLGAAGGGAAFALVNNMRLIAHPWNSISTIGKVEKMFADIKKDGTVLNKLWNNPDTNILMRDAYARMHKLEGGAKSRLGLFKKRLDKATYDALKQEMETALKSGNKMQIAKATEKIRVITDAKTGSIPNLWRKIRGKAAPNFADMTKNCVIKDAALKNFEQKYTGSLSKQMLHGFKGAGGLGGLFMLGAEFLFAKDNIIAAFEKDNATGKKQLGQTAIKGIGSLVGWTAGEAIGTWAGAKIGAAVGTAICPGLGTAIGAVAGLVGGSIGTWTMGKLTKKFVGEDVGAKVKVEKMKKTAQGQAQLLQLTAQQAQDDKKLDPKVAQALQNVISSYNAVA